MSQGTEAVVLVEDEDHVRPNPRSNSANQGYHVLSASHGDEVLASHKSLVILRL